MPLVPAWPEAFTCVVGVETFAFTVAEPLELTVLLAVADTVGVETLPETWVPLAETPAFACADAVGVEAVAAPEAAAGAV